jgi:hypothetical protein
MPDVPERIVTSNGKLFESTLSETESNTGQFRPDHPSMRFAARRSNATPPPLADVDKPHSCRVSNSVRMTSSARR